MKVILEKISILSGFQTPIRIDRIVARNYLLPAVQEEIRWSSPKVKALLDSTPGR